VQDLCTGDDVELVLGETYGLRVWSIYSTADINGYGQWNTAPDDFRLIGHFGNEWDLTQPLVGRCQADDDRLEQYVTFGSHMDAELVEFTVRNIVSEILEVLPETVPMMDLSRTRIHVHFGRAVRSVDWMLEDPFDDSRRLLVPSDFMQQVRTQELTRALVSITGRPLPHAVGHPACTCGIYAYHDKNSLQLRKTENSRGFVLGLVRAYGHVTLGTKGLRAEKAQAIAVTTPQDCALPDRIIAPILAGWKAAGITILPTPTHLLDFAEHGGYLENPDDLQPEKKEQADG
jgi:hypothetical protein